MRKIISYKSYSRKKFEINIISVQALPRYCLFSLSFLFLEALLKKIKNCYQINAPKNDVCSHRKLFSIVDDRPSLICIVRYYLYVFSRNKAWCDWQSLMIIVTKTIECYWRLFQKIRVCKECSEKYTQWSAYLLWFISVPIIIFVSIFVYCLILHVIQPLSNKYHESKVWSEITDNLRGQTISY